MPRGGGGFRPGGGMGMGMGDHFGGGMGQHVNNPQTQVYYDNQPKNQPQFNFGIFIIVLTYSAFLVFFTFLLILTKKRVLTYVRVPSVLYFVTFYLINLFILRGVFGYHFIYQIVTTCAMGFSFVKFKNLSVIGLTGGIGCGKSTFAKILEGKNLAAKIIDCDRISEQLKEPGGKCYNLIVQQFGHDIVDSDTRKIDKDKLRNLVFNNRALKKNLEKIMHWEIFKEIIVQIWNVFYGGIYNFAVLDAPLLYETKVLEWIAYPIVVVHVSDKELWLKRIMARDRCSKEEALLKIGNQMPIETKVQMAEIKVDNLGDENSMMKQFGEQFLQYITV